MYFGAEPTLPGIVCANPIVDSNSMNLKGLPNKSWVVAWRLLSQRHRVIEPTIKVTQMNDKTKILVVDDNEVVRHSFLRSLTGTHCRVEAAWNGEEALRAMEQQAFDVVLLDLRMPGMDGMQVLKAIKDKWPETEVVVITGYPSVETAKEAVRLGAHNYLAKPVGPVDVINAANDAVTQKKWSLHRDRANHDGGTASGNASVEPAHRLAG